jgi:hypothetical protein
VSKKTTKKKPKLTELDKKYDEKTVAAMLAEFDAAYDAGLVTFIYPQRGRPSLNGESAESPTIGFRLTPDLRERATAIAQQEGLSISALARRALEDYVNRVAVDPSPRTDPQDS